MWWTMVMIAVVACIGRSPCGALMTTWLIAIIIMMTITNLVVIEDPATITLVMGPTVLLVLLLLLLLPIALAITPPTITITSRWRRGGDPSIIQSKGEGATIGTTSSSRRRMRLIYHTNLLGGGRQAAVMDPPLVTAGPCLGR